MKKVNLLYLIFFNLFFIDIKKVSDYIGTRNVGQVRSHLQKIKDALLSSENNLRLANNKAEDLSIKKLTKNAPSVRAMFEVVDENGE